MGSICQLHGVSKKEQILWGFSSSNSQKHDKAKQLSSAISITSLYRSTMEAIGDLKKNVSCELNKKIFETVANIATNVSGVLLACHFAWKGMGKALKKKLRIQNKT